MATMHNLSAESFPDDSIITNVSSALQTPSTSAQLDRDLQLKRQQQNAQQQLVLLSLPASFIPADADGDDDDSSRAPLSLSPDAHNNISGSVSVSTSSSSNASVSNTNKKAPVFLKSSAAKQSGPSNSNNKLSKKSASVDSLHHETLRTASSSTTTAISGRRTTRYDHVQSKVKASIQTLRQEDHRRRSAKLERHRSMPESLGNNHATTAAAASISEDAEGTEEAAHRDGGAITIAKQTLAQLHEELAAKDTIIRQMYSAYENSVRDSDAKLKLERKVDAMRLELMQANDERLHFQKELQQLQANGCSTNSSSSSTSGTASSSVYPPSSSTVSPYLMGIEESAESSSSCHHHRRHLQRSSRAVDQNNNDNNNVAIGDGLHQRRQAMLPAAAAVAFKMPADPRAIAGHSVNSDYKLLLNAGDLTEDDDNHINVYGRENAGNSNRNDIDAGFNADEDDELLLFDALPSSGGVHHQAAGQYAIISSSSTSQQLLAMHEEDDDAVVAHNNHHHDVGTALQSCADAGAVDDGMRRKRRRSKPRRLVHGLSKRLRRLLRKCAPCLDGERGGRSYSSRSQRGGRRTVAGAADDAGGYEAGMSLMYAVMVNEEADDDGDESVATASTEASSFN